MVFQENLIVILGPLPLLQPRPHTPLLSPLLSVPPSPLPRWIAQAPRCAPVAVPSRARRGVCSASCPSFSTRTSDRKSAHPMTLFTLPMSASTLLLASSLACPKSGSNSYKTVVFPSLSRRRIRSLSWRSSSFIRKAEVVTFGIRWDTPLPQEALNHRPFQVRPTLPILGHPSPSMMVSSFRYA